MSSRDFKPGEKIVFPPQSILTKAIKAMRANRPSNIRYRETANARRVIGLMNRPCAGILGDMERGKTLDAMLEKLLL